MTLQQYIEQSILPQYDAFDGGHQRDHALTVIDVSIKLAHEYDTDEKITLLEGDAAEVLKSLDGKYDFIFLDGQVFRQRHSYLRNSTDVLIDKVGGPRRVGHYSAHKGRGEDNDIGPLSVEKVTHSSRIHKIKLSVGTADQAGVAILPQYPPDCGTHQSMMASNINFVRFYHCQPSSYRFQP